IHYHRKFHYYGSSNTHHRAYVNFTLESFDYTFYQGQANTISFVIFGIHSATKHFKYMTQIFFWYSNTVVSDFIADVIIYYATRYMYFWFVQLLAVFYSITKYICEYLIYRTFLTPYRKELAKCHLTFIIFISQLRFFHYFTKHVL